jgi:hypothetical protein
MKRAGIGDRMGDGLRVRIRGKVSVYERTGAVQLQMTSIDPKYTLGLIAEERDRVLRALSAEGLLTANGRRPIVGPPLRVALLTSTGSAAAEDFLHELTASGLGFLVTLHGPRNPVVPLEMLLTETSEIAGRLAAGRLRPRSPMALAYAVTSASTNADERTVNDLAESVGGLEQRVMRQEDDHHPQAFLDELFTTRHTLLTVRTMAAQAVEVIERAVNLTVDWDKGDRRMLKDLRDQYRRLDRISRAQLDFLEGVTDFYRARNDTRMTLAGERLAVIAAITLPVTAISSVVGMNVIVNDRTHWGWLAVLLVVMTGMSLWLLRWAHKQGWW